MDTAKRLPRAVTDPRARRKTLERDWQRREILDAALRIFASKGYVETSMTEVAELSGFSVGHIYNVVGTKEQLFDAVVLREGTTLFDLIDALIEAGRRRPAAECVDALIDSVLDYFDSHREFFQIYLNEASAAIAVAERRFSRELVAHRRETQKRVRRLFARAAAEGATAKLSPDDMTTALRELINGFIAVWAHDGYHGKIRGKAKVIKHILWKGIER